MDRVPDVRLGPDDLVADTALVLLRHGPQEGLPVEYVRDISRALLAWGAGPGRSPRQSRHDLAPCRRLPGLIGSGMLAGFQSNGLAGGMSQCSMIRV
jgi:hypothetical protein